MGVEENIFNWLVCPGSTLDWPDLDLFRNGRARTIERRHIGLGLGKPGSSGPAGVTWVSQSFTSMKFY